MITINFSSVNSKKLKKLKEDLHEALVGSPGYVNSEIAIFHNLDEDLRDVSFGLVIGQANGKDKEYFIDLDGVIPSFIKVE